MAVLILKGKTRITFWARGQKGGEKAEFKTGGLGRNDKGIPNKPFYDSFKVMSTDPAVTILTVNWQKYTINLEGQDLTKIMGGFVWVTNNTQNPQEATIYLDDIQFE